MMKERTKYHEVRVVYNVYFPANKAYGQREHSISVQDSIFKKHASVKEFCRHYAEDMRENCCCRCDPPGPDCISLDHVTISRVFHTAEQEIDISQENA